MTRRSTLAPETLFSLDQALGLGGQSVSVVAMTKSNFKSFKKLTF